MGTERNCCRAESIGLHENRSATNAHATDDNRGTKIEAPKKATQDEQQEVELYRFIIVLMESKDPVGEASRLKSSVGSHQDC